MVQLKSGFMRLLKDLPDWLMGREKRRSAALLGRALQFAAFDDPDVGL